MDAGTTTRSDIQTAKTNLNPELRHVEKMHGMQKKEVIALETSAV